MKQPIDPTSQTHESNPQYWQQHTHGASWDRVREALKRDWAQTQSDFHVGGLDLNQQLTDTVKQASGTEPIPVPTAPNAPPPPVARAWRDVEPAIRYGVGAREQYGAMFERWDDALERKLAAEWDERGTGTSFASARALIRRGWEAAPGERFMDDN